MRIPLLDLRVTVDRQPSGIWHYAQPCGHRVYLAAGQPVGQSASVVYNGGPLWKDGYSWQNVYWGSYFSTPPAASWVQRVDAATSNIEADPGYSGGLREYNVGMGKLAPHVLVGLDPAKQLSDGDVQKALTGWISDGTVNNFGTLGAYNIFLPPGTSVSLSQDVSCSQFCDYHNSVDGANGPFYTVEPYPCSQGCNQCTSNPFDTLTQGLSEEIVELKTDMDPGSGWVIGNEELCDFCDAKFVCNRIGTGEYVNAWYDRNKAACWMGK